MRLHRWIALTVGVWFALLGLTGTLLVWHGELDRALNPGWFAPRTACVVGGDRSARPVAQALSLHARHSAAPAVQVMAPELRSAAYVVWSKAPSGARIQHFIDVGCGEYLGRREWGAARFDRAHFVPAMYELHRSLLSGEIGHVLVGWVGLLLLGVTITGAIASWPRIANRAGWARTLSVRRGSTPRGFYHDLHRATGMWLLGFMLLMSISGVYLCFPKQTRAVIAAVLPTAGSGPAVGTKPPKNDARTSAIAPTPDALVARAERLWPDAAWSRLQLPSGDNTRYEIRLLQSGEPRKDTGDTRVWLDAGGRVDETRNPLDAPAGDVLIAWLFPLHSGEALGVPGRALWTLLGLVPLLLFATGVWLWWQRRVAKSRALLAGGSIPTRRSVARKAPDTTLGDFQEKGSSRP
jgi:uncharacterized iron-regulated membrane protein